MRFDECVEKGMIKRDPKASMRVETSLDAAERFLSSSKRNLEIREYEMVAIAAYNSAFHSARSLLFARGYVERSHLCLGLAIRALYSGPVIDLIKTWDKNKALRA
ncbi:HEPN domain-containing protein [Candidatus Methanocrinis natronophilus]|uniref:HEPN domain-containing protein n=1 Tax=Candidatus Methanocrinis natronophilus TaxID=3033396 RepID=A0ABT5X7G1_9EURY|nr:HEPN domain-containing protein [Candidatus Methanocrinis natronophilus]MDF0590633.1 HEPN domain-containing protein [Candidatus Methanocrinis natronophilus]